jgi:hypothetical protein
VDVVVACPFVVSTMVWQPAPGAHSLTVAVKATLALVPGGVAAIAATQEPFHGDVGWEDDPRASLRAAAELVPLKRRVDVLLAGHARAPGAVAVESLFVQLAVGGLRKTLAVTGKRAWTPTREGLRPGPIVPFRAIPIRYELGARGPDNPIGVDPRPTEAGALLPSVSAAPGATVASPAAGFGPLRMPVRLARHRLGDAAHVWAARAGLAGGPPPDGFDYAVFNAAPPDQQLDALAPGASIVLENLSPLAPRVETRLPLVRARIFRAPPRGGVIELDARCDTLFVDADRSVATLVWRAATPIEAADDAAIGRVVVVAETDGARVGPADVARFLARRFPVVLDARGDADLDPSRARVAAAEETTMAGYPMPGGPVELVRPRQRTISDDPTNETTRSRRGVATVVDEGGGSRDALPFRGAAPRAGEVPAAAPSNAGLPFGSKDAPRPAPPALPRPARPERPSLPRNDAGDEATALLVLPTPPPSSDEAPPHADRAATPTPPPPPPLGAVGLGVRARLGGMTLLTKPAEPPPPLPFRAPEGGESAARAPAPPLPPTSSLPFRSPAPDALPFRARDEAPSSPRRDTSAPPPPDDASTVAPLPFRASAPPGAVPRSSHAPTPFVAPRVSAPLPPPPPPPPPSAEPTNDGGATISVPQRGIDVSVYCAVRAEVWAGAPLGEVLARRGLDETEWRANEARQAEALGAEAARGGAELALVLFDAMARARADARSRDRAASTRSAPAASTSAERG